MKLNDKQIDIIRNTAIFFEEKDVQISLDLMSVALFNRPNGPILKRKFKEYSRNFKVSDDIELSFVNACKKATTNLQLFAEFLYVAVYIYPRNKYLKELKDDASSVLYLKEKVTNLELQVELLRNKFAQMHKALCYSEVLKVKEIDDYAAKISPVEFFDKGSKETLIVFGGMATAPSMPPKEFFASFLKKSINVIFVKDFEQCWYQKGLMGLSDDMDSTIEYLRGIVPKQTEKLICLGTSAGGHAAIRVGGALGANRILAFAPQTKINKGIFKKFKSLDSRLVDLSLKRSVDLDLKLFLSQIERVPQIDIYYGSRNASDLIASEYIKDFARLHEYDTAEHSIARYLKSTGELALILDNI